MEKVKIYCYDAEGSKGMPLAHQTFIEVHLSKITTPNGVEQVKSDDFLHNIYRS